LKELGYLVLEARDGSAALAFLEDNVRIDMIFTDVVLPSGMTGADIVKRAAELRPGLKALFTTGYSRNAIVHHGRLDRASSSFPSPFHLKSSRRRSATFSTKPVKQNTRSPWRAWPRGRSPRLVNFTSERSLKR
jgi:CheY-like chemotaxis protein